MKYSEFGIEGFIEDKKFREWVYNPSNETNSFWEKWLAQNPDKEDIVKKSRDLLLSIKLSSNVIPKNRQDALWERIEKQNDKFDALQAARKTRKLFPSYYWYPKHTKLFNLKYVAAASIIILLGFFYYYNNRQTEQSLVKATSQIVVKSNPAGQKSQIQLPDGSMVYLNSESKLIYEDNFSSKRIVTVEGEAFFKVKKDALKPFVVKANHLSATVLGTSFNVRAALDESNTQITLVTGKLVVEDALNKNFVTLLPKEVASSRVPGQQIFKTKSNTEIITYWTQGIIYFDKTNFTEVVNILEGWYGVSIHLEGVPAQPITCTGKFTNENLNNVLNSLSFSLGFQHVINGRHVKIVF